MLRQISIVGTGLIGGSLALALRKNRFKGEIVGCDSTSILRMAKRRGVIDRGFTDPVEACYGSDVVVLATPVSRIINLIAELAPTLSAETLVTDVGSTKHKIITQAQRVFGSGVSHRFLGGHPMAGKENSGIEFADADLFRGAVWFFTPLQEQVTQGGKLA